MNREPPIWSELDAGMRAALRLDRLERKISKLQVRRAALIAKCEESLGIERLFRRRGCALDVCDRLRDREARRIQELFSLCDALTAQLSRLLAARRAAALGSV